MATHHTPAQWNNFIAALRQSVKPATGCTEPISLALAAAKAAACLSGAPTQIRCYVSPNLMKNGLGVTVPGTGMTGLPVAAALGAIGGQPDAGLNVLCGVTADDIAAGKAFLASGAVSVEIKEPCGHVLYSEATVYSGDDQATVTICGDHTHVTEISHNGTVIYQDDAVTHQGGSDNPFADACARDIYDFATQAPVSMINFMRQAADLNDALAREGMSNPYGLQIGRSLEKQRERGLLSKDLLSDIMIRTSSASDARMGGAQLPAMSNSGSGNQGIAATQPVVVVAEYLQADEEQLIRALTLSHLMAIYIHSQFPPLSALCAATTASMGAAAGIAWLFEGKYEPVAMAISSMIGDITGIICDGASNSCAMKVSSGVSAAYKAVLMAMNQQCVGGNDGIVCTDVDKSIANLCALASLSMQHTDVQIIEIMANKAKSA